MSQKTRAAITTELNANLKDNTTQFITPALLRQVVQDITDSSIVPLTDSVTSGLIKTNGSGTISVSAQSTFLVSDYGAVGDGVTDDTTAINSALTAGTGAVVMFQSGKTYLVTGALVISSNTTINARSATINLQAGTNANLLKNTASIAARTVTDAVTTAGSSTVTSATANFVAGDVGKAIGILAAGPNYGLSTAPGTLYGTISSVTNSTTVIMSNSATLSVTGGTLSVFPSRDSNISIIGGTWNQGNKDAIYQTTNSHNFFFRRLDGLYIRDLTMLSTGTTGKGGRYAISQGDITNSDIADMNFTTGGDGVHTQGASQFITIRDCFGNTGDDMVAFTGVDGQSQIGSLLGDVEGDITDVVVQNIFPNGSHTAIKVTSGQGSNNVQRVAKRFMIKNIVGNTALQGINVANYSGVTNFDGEIDGVNVVPGTGNQSINIQATSANMVRIRNVTWGSEAGCPTAGVISINAALKNLWIDGLSVFGNTTGTGIGVKIGGNISSIVAKNLLFTDFPPTSHAFDFASASTVIKSFIISHVYRDVSSGNLINVESTATSININDLCVSDGLMGTGSVINSLADSANTMKIRVSNWRGLGGALVIGTFPFELNLDNVEIAPSSGAVRANSAAATPVRVRGSNVSLTSGSLFSRTASQALSVTGITCSTDLSILTPLDGDLVNNNNGALACGTGPAIFHTGGTGVGWKNIYSGTTY